MVGGDAVVRAKRALRADCEARRRQASDAAGPKAGAAAVGHFFSAIELPAGCVVSGYWPMRGEFDVLPLLEALHARGHHCALPVVAGKGRPLEFRAWSPGGALVEAAFGTMVPPDDAGRATPEVLLVPLLAFDDAGTRLGYGGGFYDLTLAALKAAGGHPLAVGCAFAAQRVDALPRDGTDQRLDWVVTERRAMEFHREAA